jgi:hypothetical protein
MYTGKRLKMMDIFPYKILENVTQTYLREAERFVNIQVYKAEIWLKHEEMEDKQNFYGSEDDEKDQKGDLIYYFIHSLEISDLTDYKARRQVEYE